MKDTDELVRRLTQMDVSEVSEVALRALKVFEMYEQGAEGSADQSRLADEVTDVRNAIVSLFDRCDRCPAELIGALASLGDPTLIPVFRKCLLQQLGEQNAGGMYAAMSALDQLGEELFQGRQQRSVLDWEVNRSLAVAYLERFRK